MRVKGTVKFFDSTKGWGFITRDDGEKDVFVHKAQLAKTAIEELEDGDKISFETEEAKNGKGLRAINVKVE